MGTVVVNLKKDWFGPSDSLYQARDNPHEFPEEWAAEPSKEQKEKYPAQKYAVLPSTAVLVDNPKVVAVKQQTASGDVTVASVVEDGAKSVGGTLDEAGVELPAQSTAAAEKAADKLGVGEVGGKPRESGPLPAGTKK